MFDQLSVLSPYPPPHSPRFDHHSAESHFTRLRALAISFAIIRRLLFSMKKLGPAWMPHPLFPQLTHNIF